MKYNFGAGPGTLPKSVLEQAAQSVIDYNGTGLSILEISHRSSLFSSIIEEAQALVMELLNLDKDYEVLFLHGGATTQSAVLPLNLLEKGQTGCYVDSGLWAHKAMAEAAAWADVTTVASSRAENYSFIPKNFSLPKNAGYLHICTNNTAFGTQLFEFPKTDVPLVVDMSSDILSRVIDYNQFAVMYGGLQKNMGPAGAAVVIVRKSLLKKVDVKLPGIFNLRQHIASASIYNTPSVYAIYVSLLMLRHLKQTGGVPAIEQINNHKAELLYKEIDRNALFKGICVKEDRSKMNACFVMNDVKMESGFIEFAEGAGIVGIAGHKQVGGFRVSMYNSMPLEGVKHLIEVMQRFEQMN